MRVAALYDVHGNLPALQAVLADVEREGVEGVVAGGDVVWGPFPAECVALLRAAGALFLSGNCERDVFEDATERSRWCHEQLGVDERAFVGTWPATVELRIEGLGDVVFCHATPRSDDEILTRATPAGAVSAALTGVDADAVVCGHTHVQYDRRTPGAPRLVNAGSVGLPYEGRPGAYWALLGPDVELRRTDYDFEAALASIGRSAFPDAMEIFPESIRGETSAESATEQFESRRYGA